MLDGVRDLLLACLHDAAFLPLLALGVALDGPVPVLPTEVVAMSAALRSGGAGDPLALLGLWAALVVGSVAGDLGVFAVSRRRGRRVCDGPRSARLLVRVARAPVRTLLVLRFLPAGRLLGVLLCATAGTGWRVFVPATLLCAAVWASWIVVVGLALGPVVGTSLWTSIGVAVALSCTAGLVALVRGRWAARGAPAV